MELAGTLFGSYRLRRRIGHGGMGQVFAAVVEGTEQEVALKLLHPEKAQDRQLVARFLKEGQVLRELQHPGVVRILDCDKLEDGTVFLAMELLQGFTLHEWMQRHPGPMPLNDALAIGRQIAEVMAIIHARNIVHRDLKPANIFLCPEESIAPGYRVKLLDFGIAKAPPAASTPLGDTQVQTQQASTPLGTARYMAPEQLWDPAKATGAADVYSLGVLLFELLAGRPPFDTNEPVELAAMHAQKAPPLLREFAPTTPWALVTFTASMLSKSPAERPSMQQCQDMLSRSWEGVQDECPLPGLSPFTEDQAGLFFGRETAIEELLDLLETSRTGRRRWVQVEGPSGIGKSSLVQAGLLPRLKEQSSPNVPPWRIANMRPGHAPLRSLALALQAAYVDVGLPDAPEQIEVALKAGPEALLTWVTAHTSAGCCLLLVLEQAEELFTLDEEERHRVDALVSTALTAPDSPLRLLTTLRSDFIGRLEQLPLLARHLNEASRHYLSAMEEGALTQVVQGMAQRAGLRLSGGLAEQMVHDATSGGSQLPLLGHTLRGLWALSSDGLLTHEHYKQLGGVGGALSRQATQLLDDLGEEGQECAKWLILELVQVSRGVPALRRPCSRQDVLAAVKDRTLAEKVLLQLSGMSPGARALADQALRLVTVSGESDPSQQRVELVHETLLQTVPTISKWIQQERARIERLEDLEVAAYTWEEAGCPLDDLPTGTLLQHYLKSAGTETSQVHPARRASDRAKRFLDAARRLDRRRKKLRMTVLWAAIAAGVAITISAFQAIQQRQRAEAALRVAEEAQRRSETARVRADKTLQQVRKLISNVVSDTDWQLSRRDFTLDVRQQVFANLDSQLAELSEADRQTPEIRLVTIQTWQRRSDLAFHDESLSAANDLLLKARQSLAQGLQQQPGDFNLLFQSGLNLSKQGKIFQARGERDQARSSFTQAVQLFDRLQPEDTPNDRRTRATSHSELADLELEDDQAETAIARYDGAIRLLESNVQDTSLPKKARLYEQSLLAETRASRAKATQATRALDDARRFFAQALSMANSVHQSEPENTYYRWVLARVLVQSADFEAQHGARTTAADSYQRAQALGRELLKGEKPNKRYALVLAQALLGEERLARKRGALTLAAQRHEARCTLMRDFRRQDPDDARFMHPDCPP
jgi:serine/threonine protein kinase